MAATQQDTAGPRRLQPLAWFQFNPTTLFLSPGFGRIQYDDSALAALFRFVLRAWHEGPLSREVLLRDCGDGAMRLIEFGVLVEDDGLYSMPWLEQQRTASDKMRVDAAKAGRASAAVRARSTPARKRSTPVERPLTTVERGPTTPQQGEERREEEREREESESNHARTRAGGSEFTRWWDAEWERTRLGQKFAWETPDAVAMAACAKKGDALEVRRRITALLESTDAWVAQNATPRLLRSQWNRFAVEVVVNGKPNETSRLMHEYDLYGKGLK